MAGLPKCVVCKKEINKYSVDYYRVTDGFIHLECVEGYKKLHPKAKKFELKERIEQDDAFINKTMDYLTELGMEIKNPILFKQASGKDTLCDLYYLKQNIDISKIIIQKEEVDEVKWASIDEINELMVKDFLHLLKECL